MTDCIIRVQVAKATAEAEKLARSFSVLTWKAAQ